MKPKNTALAEIDHAIDIDTGECVATPIADVVAIPFLGFANTPEAEMRWRRADMQDCFTGIEALLEGYELTFDQQLEIYNQVPLGIRAVEMPRGDLIDEIKAIVCETEEVSA